MRKSIALLFLLCAAYANSQQTISSVTFNHLAKSSSLLWATCNGCPEVYAVGSSTPVAGIPAVPTYFNALGSNGPDAWVTTNNGVFYRISPTRQAVGFSSLFEPELLAFDAAEVWVSSHDTVNHIDNQTGAVLSFIKVGYPMQDIAFDAQHNLWALLYSGSVVKFAPDASLPSAIISVGANTTYNRYQIGSDGSTLWVSSPSGITRINPVTNAIVGNYPTEGTRFAFDGHNMWLLVPGGFARLNNAGVPIDLFHFLGGDGFDIVFDGANIQAINYDYLHTVPLANLQPLPVKFTLLNYNCSGSSTVISWKAEGNQTANFVLQRSTNGSSWEQIKMFQPNPSGSYSFIDKNVPSNALYRILETENTGRIYMSTILKSSCGIPAAYSLYPNPARNQTTINVFANETGRGRIRVYNSDGALVKSFDSEIMKGANQIPLDVSLMPPGIYQIITTWGGNLKSASFIRQ
jgi:hypothetical protein